MRVNLMFFKGFVDVLIILKYFHLVIIIEIQSIYFNLASKTLSGGITGFERQTSFLKASHQRKGKEGISPRGNGTSRRRFGGLVAQKT